MLKRTVFFVLLLLANLSLMAQQTITGVVKDTGGQPMSGVTVVVKGTSAGTLTGIRREVFSSSACRSYHIKIFIYRLYES
jgi:hypothetical protein